LLVLAEDERGGRAAPRALTVGDEPVELTLTLAPWVTLHGTIDGAVPTDAHVHVVPVGVEGYQLEVAIVDGAFTARVPAGAHWLAVVRADQLMRQVLAHAGTDARPPATDVRLPVTGTIMVTIHLRPDAAVDIPGGGVVLLPGRVEVPAGGPGELWRRFLRGLQEGWATGGATTPEPGGGAITLGPLSPGPYTVCGAALPGDMRDPAFSQRVYAHVGDVAGACTRSSSPVSRRRRTSRWRCRRRSGFRTERRPPPRPPAIAPARGGGARASGRVARWRSGPTRPSMPPSSASGSCSPTSTAIPPGTR
ncbi:MAG: hypothetical protein KC464_17495, partial [Myxococcales bacterium]|nr:hypothetical protein [Myxococcales bacterium]